MSNLVKFSNDINSLKELSQFTVEEADIFFKCILFYQDGRSVLKYEDVLDELAYLNKQGEKYFISKCRTMLKKIGRISFEYENPATKDWTLYPSIFSKLQIHSTANGDLINSLEFEVHPDFKDWFLNLKKYLTTFNFADYLSIKTQYTKHLFRHLRQYRTQGWWCIPIDDYFSQEKNMTMPGFRTLIGIPKSYKYANIKQRVIVPAVRELGSVNQSLKTRIINSFKNQRKPLTEYDIAEKERLGEFTFFKALDYEEIKKSNRVIAIKFTFVPQKHKQTNEENVERKKLRAQSVTNNDKGGPKAQAKELNPYAQGTKEWYIWNRQPIPEELLVSQQQTVGEQFLAQKKIPVAQGVDPCATPQYLNIQQEQLARQTDELQKIFMYQNVQPQLQSTELAPPWKDEDIPIPDDE